MNLTGLVPLTGTLPESGTALPNGTYHYTIYSANTSWRAAPGVFSIRGTNALVAVPFALVTYAVTFTETGLPTGANWSVTLGGVGRRSTGTNVAFEEPNSSYAYVIGSVSGYSANRSGGSVRVEGSGAVVSLTFATTAKAATFLGLPLAEGYGVLAGVVVGVSGLALAVGLRARARGRREPTGTPPKSPGPP